MRLIQHTARYFALIPLLSLSSLAYAAEYTLREIEQAPPDEVSAAIAEVLQPKAFQLLEGGEPVWEFWWVKEVPVEELGDGNIAPTALKLTTLLGVVRVHKSQRDYRDDQIYVDTYTMRYAEIPQDGNHLGTAPFDSFALLVPVERDEKIDTFGTQRGLQNASKTDTATDHPIALSLRPTDTPAAETPQLAEPADEHKSLEITLPVKAGDAEGTLVMGVVYEGHGKL